MRVTVRRIVSENEFGTIFSGVVDDERHARDGQRVKVRALSKVLGISPAVGEVWIVEGKVKATSWGEQVEASSATRERMTGELVKAYLAHNVPGIGPKRALLLHERYGDGLGEVLGDESRVSEIAETLAGDRPVLALSIATMAVGAWRRADAEAKTVEWLSKRGVEDLRWARRLIRILGADAVPRLETNPYCLVPLMAWGKVDRLGLKALAEAGENANQGDRRRLVGAVDAVVKEGLAQGCTALTRPELHDRLARLLGVPAGSRLVEVAVEAGLRNGAVIDGGETLRFPGAALMEDAVSSMLVAIRTAGRMPSRTQLKALQKGYLVDTGALHPEQAAALLSILLNPVSCLQGGAGVGKTHTTRAICAAWTAVGGNVVLAALSGKAALRLSQASGRVALTLARLLRDLDKRSRLEAELVDAGGERRDDALAALKEMVSLDERTLLVIDEASMVDLATAYRVLQHVPEGARVLFVGDDAQLPPISFGLIYHRLVEDRTITARLTVVHRQSEESGIPAVAAAIRAKAMPTFSRYIGLADGVSFVRTDTKDLAAAVERVAGNLGGFDKGDLLVVTATNEGPAGVATLNRMFQTRRLDDLKLPVVKGHWGEWFSPGDPCIHLRNDYRLALANGSMGKVVSVDERTRRVTARFDDRDVVFGDPGEGSPALEREVEGSLIDLALAYVVTCHKCQGSQAERIIVPVYSTALLSPAWLYTAVTRAERQVVLVGDPEALKVALTRPWANEERQVGFVWPWTSPSAGRVS